MTKQKICYAVHMKGNEMWISIAPYSSADGASQLSSGDFARLLLQLAMNGVKSYMNLTLNEKFPYLTVI